MGKKSYTGGGTVIGPRSGWFTFNGGAKPKRLSSADLVKIAEADALKAEKRQALKDATFAEMNKKKERRKRNGKAKSKLASTVAEMNLTRAASTIEAEFTCQSKNSQDNTGINLPKSRWTPERVAMLECLWNQGISARRIADSLGGTTRNAVMGKAARLGLRSK